MAARRRQTAVQDTWETGDRIEIDLIVGALPGNAPAVGMCERRGYRPTWTNLSRFRGR